MTTNKADELLKQAKEIEARAAASKTRADVAETGASPLAQSLNEIKEINATVKATKKGYTNTKTVLIGFYENALKPMVDLFKPAFKAVAGFYDKWIWQKFAYKTDKQTGERKINKKRAGVVLTATFCAVAALTPTTPGAIVRAVTVEPATAVAHEIIDAGRVASTYHEKEILYLNRESQTSIDREDGTYMVKGCKTQECDAESSIYFVIKDSFVNSVMNQVKNGSMLYNTHQIAAAIPTGAVARCEVTNYGGRVPLFLYFGAKPVLFEAKCSTLTPSFDDAAAPKAEFQKQAGARTELGATLSAVLPSSSVTG